MAASPFFEFTRIDGTSEIRIWHFSPIGIRDSDFAIGCTRRLLTTRRFEHSDPRIHVGLLLAVIHVPGKCKSQFDVEIKEQPTSTCLVVNLSS